MKKINSLSVKPAQLAVPLLPVLPKPSWSAWTASSSAAPGWGNSGAPDVPADLSMQRQLAGARFGKVVSLTWAQPQQCWKRQTCPAETGCGWLLGLKAHKVVAVVLPYLKFCGVSLLWRYINVIVLFFVCFNLGMLRNNHSAWNNPEPKWKFPAIEGNQRGSKLLLLVLSMVSQSVIALGNKELTVFHSFGT